MHSTLLLALVAHLLRIYREIRYRYMRTVWIMDHTPLLCFFYMLMQHQLQVHLQRLLNLALERLGLGVGAEPPDQLALTVDEEFVKVPARLSMSSICNSHQLTT